MSLNVDKLNVIIETYKEIEEIHIKLRQLLKDINGIGLSLLSKYKLVSSIINDKYAASNFTEPTDYTVNTLYYCLDPLLDGLGLFFIPSKDGSRLLPIQFAVGIGPNDKPTLDISFNPAFSEPALNAKGLSYKDVLIKFQDLVEPIKNQATTALEELFTNPPKAEGKDSEFFDNYIMQKLFEITQNPEFKNTILKPKSKIIAAH